MPLEKFTLDHVKGKFVRPILRRFLEARNGRTSATDSSCRVNAVWAALENEIAGPLRAAPFAGKYPTRVFIFKAPQDNLIYSYYYGKRTRVFDLEDINETLNHNWRYIEFDRQNVILYFDSAQGKFTWNRPLCRRYYPSLYMCGVGPSNIWKVNGYWNQETQRATYATDNDLILLNRGRVPSRPIEESSEAPFEEEDEPEDVYPEEDSEDVDSDERRG